ncbi:MAG: hypothetical protein Q9162_007162 [Coniocarpon cinnabarinum]
MFRRYANAIERARADYGPLDEMPWSYISELDAFTIYHTVQERHKPPPDSSILEALGHAVAGATGTAISNVLVYPLDLVVTRLQVQRKESGSDEGPASNAHYDGLRDAVQKIYCKEGGVRAFYAGISQDTFKSIADSFLFFFFYNSFWRTRQARLQSQERGLAERWVDDVGIGMLAGAVTRAITAPMQQIITQKQTMVITSPNKGHDQKAQKSDRVDSVTGILKNIYHTRGLQGFWAGYSATLILTLNPSLTMSVDSTLRRLTSRSSEPGPTATFLVAAVSKAAASSVMYPVSLAKTRAQAAIASHSDTTQQRKAGPGSVLLMIPRMVQTDGVISVYSGLGAEVIKGFFAHGITMLIKQRVHRLVIQTYFYLVKCLGRLKYG